MLRRLQSRAHDHPTQVQDCEMAKEQRYYASKLNKAIGTLSLALIAPKQRLYYVKDYPLVHFTSVLGISRTGTLYLARKYTLFIIVLI